MPTENTKAPAGAQQLLTTCIDLRCTYGEDLPLKRGLFQVREDLPAYVALLAASNLIDSVLSVCEDCGPVGDMSSGTVGAVRTLLAQAKAAVDSVWENSDNLPALGEGGKA